MKIKEYYTREELNQVIYAYIKDTAKDLINKVSNNNMM